MSIVAKSGSRLSIDRVILFDPQWVNHRFALFTCVEELGMAEQAAAVGRLNRPKLSAGNPSLDRVLGGGIPRDSLSILAGPPGAGKTIMAQQIAFSAAQAGQKVVYFTNV